VVGWVAAIYWGHRKKFLNGILFITHDRYAMSLDKKLGRGQNIKIAHRLSFPLVVRAPFFNGERNTSISIVHYETSTEEAGS
jgi:hypothetical protein